MKIKANLSWFLDTLFVPPGNVFPVRSKIIIALFALSLVFAFQAYWSWRDSQPRPREYGEWHVLEDEDAIDNAGQRRVATFWAVLKPNEPLGITTKQFLYAFRRGNVKRVHWEVANGRDSVKVEVFLNRKRNTNNLPNRFDPVGIDSAERSLGKAGYYFTSPTHQLIRVQIIQYKNDRAAAQVPRYLDGLCLGDGRCLWDLSKYQYLIDGKPLGAGFYQPLLISVLCAVGAFLLHMRVTRVFTFLSPSETAKRGRGLEREIHAARSRINELEEKIATEELTNTDAQAQAAMERDIAEMERLSALLKELTEKYERGSEFET